MVESVIQIKSEITINADMSSKIQGNIILCVWKILHLETKYMYL